MIFIIANWKMNPQTTKEAESLFSSAEKELKNIKNAEAVICPPSVFLSSGKKEKNVKLGAQDCFYEEKGAYTGEVSVGMVKDFGCEYVIVGHSERRKYFNETDETVNKKIKAVLSSGLIPVFCIGETEEQRKNNETEEVIKRQIEKGLSEISRIEFQSLNLVVAYEPVWAIGTGNPCSAEEARKMCLFIKKILSSKISGQIPILYGGSVNSGNSASYIKEAGMDGLLVGGASLDAEEFVKIVKNAV
jgi:triosephosphate isomerase